MIKLTTEQAKKLVFNKTVAVVGNAKSIFDFEYGKLIDNQDVVVRFNIGMPVESMYKSTGSRTDILAGFKFNYRCWKLAGKPVIFYRGPWSKDKAFHRRWEDVKEWRAEIHREDHISLVTNKGPSNGIMLLEVLVHLFLPKKIMVFGFDNFKTKSWYPESKGDIGGGKFHDGQGEARYIASLGFMEHIPGVLIWTK